MTVRWLRSSGQSINQVFYTINKIDGLEQEENLFEFYSLGVEKLFPISAEHKYGVPDFLDTLVAMLPGQALAETADMIKVAVAGRPNVGKSSLINPSFRGGSSGGQ